MSRFTVAALALFTLAAAACSDTACPDVSLGASGSLDDDRSWILRNRETLANWHNEARRLLSEAPADSGLYIIVLLDPQAKAEFVEWADAAGAEITYEYQSISGYNVRMPVAALAGLLDRSGISGIDWARGVDAQGGCGGDQP